VAVNCWVAPTITDGFVGVTAIEESVTTGAWTLSTVLPEMLPEEAEMVVVPAETLVANPVELIVARLVEEEVQVADPVRFCVLLSE